MILDDEERHRARSALRPAVEWRCSRCYASGGERLSANGNAMSFISGIKWHHREISPDCENDSLIVFVPKEDLPTTVELRERERKFDEEYLERRRSAAREAAAKAKAAGKKAAEAK